MVCERLRQCPFGKPSRGMGRSIPTILVASLISSLSSRRNYQRPAAM
jgi:hypothetical protein